MVPLHGPFSTPTSIFNKELEFRGSLRIHRIRLVFNRYRYQRNSNDRKANIWRAGWRRSTACDPRRPLRAGIARRGSARCRSASDWSAGDSDRCRRVADRASRRSWSRRCRTKWRWHRGRRRPAPPTWRSNHRPRPFPSGSADAPSRRLDQLSMKVPMSSFHPNDIGSLPNDSIAKRATLNWIPRALK